MRQSNEIYERHVLGRVRDRLSNQVGAAVDAGAFIGTHSATLRAAAIYNR